METKESWLCFCGCKEIYNNKVKLINHLILTLKNFKHKDFDKIYGKFDIITKEVF